MKISSQTFLREKVATVAVSKWYTDPLTLSYPVQYAKRLGNIIARKTAVMYTFVVEPLVGQCEYAT